MYMHAPHEQGYMFKDIVMTRLIESLVNMVHVIQHY